MAGWNWEGGKCHLLTTAHNPLKGRVHPKTKMIQKHNWTLRNKSLYIINPESALFVRGRSFSFKMSLSSSDCFVILPVWHAWLKETSLCAGSPPIGWQYQLTNESLPSTESCLFQSGMPYWKDYKTVGAWKRHFEAKTPPSSK